MLSDDVVKAFKNGVWVRTLVDIDAEIAVLDKRRTYTAVDWNLTHIPAARANPKFTRYSPAHFMVEGIPVRMHLPNHPGVIFRHDYRPAHFYDGSVGEVLTRTGDGDLDYTKEILDNGRGKTCQLYYPSHEQIKAHLEKKHKEYAADSYYEENPDEVAFLNWNEGLLRYGYHNIVGLYVNLEDSRCCKQAVVLRQKLQDKGVPFEASRFYQIVDGHFSYVASAKVAEIAARDRPTKFEAYLAGRRVVGTASVFRRGHGGAEGAAPAPK